MITLKNNITLDIATASTCRATKWQNKRTTWQDIVNTLSQTERTSETIKQYFSYSKDKQGEIKDVGGFVGGYLREGRRKKGYVDYRQIVCLDVDYGTLDLWIDFGLMEYAGCMYTTHKHTPEDPRLRIVFPLSRKVSPDEYEAIARVVASWLGIDAFDDTTYQPTRLMYYPSTSKDGEFIFHYTDGPIMDADEVLAELPAWQDPTTWPVSSRVKDVVKRDGSGKVEDPEDKGGIVGAFCRAYTMDEAIAEFLTEVYEPCEELGHDRYSLVGGSTSGGLVVYDNKLAYSHHATDVAGGKLLNAFDLVRLHKFADLDEKAKPDTEITKLPSYKAMAEFASKLGSVKKEVVRCRREQAADDYDEIESKAREVAEADDWIGELETEGKNGKIKNTINNAVLILQNDENLKGRLGFNEFEQRETALKPLPWDKNVTRYPRPLSDSDDAELRLYLERCYDITNKGQIADAVIVVSRANSYHPVRDYLDATEWDGVERLDTLFIDLFGVADTPYIRAVTRKAFCAAVARIYSPGCKFDYVTVIVGEQGIGKSTTLAKMGGDWFSDSVSTLVGREALESIQGSWLIELGELASLKKADIDAVKHFVSKKEDRFRVAYGKRIEHFPRRCVFFGTTNEEDFLRDVSGNRRFWVVDCKGCTGRLDFKEYLTSATIAQLWGEAKERYVQGEPLYLAEAGLEEEARAIQDKHLEKDDRSGLINEYLERLLPENWDTLDPYQRRNWLSDENNVGTVKRQRACILEIWSECLGKDPNSITRRDSYEISRIMKSLREWAPYGGTLKFKYYGSQKGFVKTETKDRD
ncbi:virulence-associated E family protein [Bacteroides fragilis]|uniref:virulence-associated E family protein n=1 Tax=Bacteroides fragilis TaxID=817 RepID=UPI002458B83D|nr:virulence-associated E family protein [Bacteroides fragilis]WPO59291.1 virulence-associated E family protein [Bacteroides fragilis]